MDLITKSIENPDVRVLFEFNGARERGFSDGYRPIHKLKKSGGDYLTTGIHRYFCKGKILSNDTVEGTITFITPEAYPNCLSVGDRIEIYDGPKRAIGTATVLEIMNKELER